MWSAIKSDLFEFVSTIKEDTTLTLNKVLGGEDDETVSIRISIVYHDGDISFEGK
jgi:hypothetical protein